MDGDGAPDPAVAAQERPVRVALVFDLGNQALGISVEPPPYPLSKLLAGLPQEAGEVLGWLPDLAVAVSGFLVDPRRGAAGVLATAGLADSAEPSATLFLAQTVQTDTDAQAAADDADDNGSDAGGRSALLIGLTLDSPISLGGTPLFGALLDGISLEDLAVTWASAAIPAGTVILPRPAAPAVDQPAYAQGPELSLIVREGANREPLRLRPPARGEGPQPSTSLPDPLAGPPVQWFPVEKRLGPLTIARIGVVGTAGAFGLALDASIRTASLDVRLTGFTVVFDPRSDIRPSSVRVALDGLAVAFGSGTLRIAGGLVRTTEETEDGPVTAYAGALTIQAGPYGIAAIGSYAEYRGAPSLFVFGLARGRFGGVPAFFVTGLAAGFGYNRRLRLPRIEEVRGFPLVRAVLRESMPALPPSSVHDAGSALAELSKGGWVPIASGAYWVAAGIAFTSFGMLDGFVMLVVQFGDRFVLSLLGVVGLRLPKLGNAVAYIELAIDAVFDVGAGEFQANALVTPNSFVFNRDGRLSGGFAFRLWFPPHERAGDFVVTIGGYHPAFDRPDWYPQVPRLAIDWRVSAEIGISGDAYAAVTPSAAMAGGNLDVRFAAGALRAWFLAHADLIVYWRPVFFEAAVSVSVGAAYTFSLGSIHRTLTIELGASLQLWGPPFTGVAHVRWAVVSFSVPINGGRRPELPGRVLDWAQFAADFLPPADAMEAAAEPVCRVRAAAGLIDVVDVDGRAQWLVSADSFALLSETVIPASELTVAGPDGPVRRFGFPRVGVFPMGSIVVDTPHRLVLSRILTPPDGDRARQVLDVGSWHWDAVRGRVPYAVWGTVNPGRAELGSRLVEVATGLRGTPPAPSPPGTPPVPLEVLDSTLIEPRRTFRLPLGEIDGSTAPSPVDSRDVVRDTIDHEDVVRRRDEVTRLLVRAGIAAGVGSDRMSVLADQVRDVFPGAPLLGPLGSTGPREAAVSPPSRRTPQAGRWSQARDDGPESLPASDAPGPSVELQAIFAHLTRSLREAGSTASDPWAMRRPSSLRAHVYDRFAGASDRGVASRHVSFRGSRTVARIDEGVSVLWSLCGARGGTVLESDGGSALRLTEFDAQDQLIGESFLAPGAVRRTRVAESCVLLLVAADEPPAAVSGWTSTTELAQLAPQALLGDGVIVRPQCPSRIPAGGVRGTRARGVTSGRLLSEGNTVATPAGNRPGWIDTRFGEPPAWLRVTLRPGGRARRGSGPYGAPGSVVLRDAVGGLRVTAEPEYVHAEGGLLHLVYRVPDRDSTGPFVVRVRPDQGWYTDAVVGASATACDERDASPATVALVTVGAVATAARR